MKRRPLVAKALLVFGGMCVLAAPSAHAITSLKQVQVSSGGRVDLYFDGKVGRSQIRTEYFNDTIQFSLSDVSVYPAKISSVTGGDIVKIFAYQYAPKLVRCRLTVKGKAEDFRDRLQLDDRGKVLTINLSDSDSVSTHAAQAVRPTAAAVVKVIPEGPKPAEAASAKIGTGERALLDRILATGSPPAPKEAPAKVIEAAAPIAAKAVSEPLSTSLRLGSANAPIAGGKPLASPMRVLGKLAIVLGLFGLLAMALKKVVRGESNISRTGAKFGAIRRFAANRLGKPAKMIEVVSTHHLGPKKSIAVVNIAGRMLVLGISNESINLITQISGDAGAAAGEPEDELGGEQDSAQAIHALVGQSMMAVPGASLGSGATAAGPARYAPTRAMPEGPSFDGLLDKEAGRPEGVRNQIRNRLEGLKRL